MSFVEIFVVIVVGLVVVGPKRLPEALRTGMLWYGRIKRSINDTKAEFEQQLGVDEIRRELHNDRIMESLRALEQSRDELKESVNSIGSEVTETIDAAVESATDNVTDNTAKSTAQLEGAPTIVEEIPVDALHPSHDVEQSEQAVSADEPENKIQP
jgi:sec-independent protein translocase protein TatB